LIQLVSLIEEILLLVLESSDGGGFGSDLSFQGLHELQNTKQS